MIKIKYRIKYAQYYIVLQRFFLSLPDDINTSRACFIDTRFSKKVNNHHARGASNALQYMRVVETLLLGFIRAAIDEKQQHRIIGGEETIPRILLLSNASITLPVQRCVHHRGSSLSRS